MRTSDREEQRADRGGQGDASRDGPHGLNVVPDPLLVIHVLGAS